MNLCDRMGETWRNSKWSNMGLNYTWIKFVHQMQDRIFNFLNPQLEFWKSQILVLAQFWLSSYTPSLFPFHQCIQPHRMWELLLGHLLFRHSHLFLSFSCIHSVHNVDIFMTYTTWREIGTHSLLMLVLRTLFNLLLFIVASVYPHKSRVIVV